MRFLFLWLLSSAVAALFIQLFDGYVIAVLGYSCFLLVLVIVDELCESKLKELGLN